MEHKREAHRKVTSWTNVVAPLCQEWQSCEPLATQDL